MGVITAGNTIRTLERGSQAWEVGYRAPAVNLESDTVTSGRHVVSDLLLHGLITESVRYTVTAYLDPRQTPENDILPRLSSAI